MFKLAQQVYLFCTIQQCMLSQGKMFIVINAFVFRIADNYLTVACFPYNSNINLVP